MGIVFRDSFWKPAGVDIDAAADALAEVHAEHGELTPPAVVSAAEPKSSALHPAFEWRNSVAAQKHREWQARQLIRSVRIVDESGTERPAYVSCIRVDESGKSRRVYDRPEVVVTKPDEWLSALGLFTAKINSARLALGDLETFAGKQSDSDRLARIAIAAKALDTARAALAS